MHFIELRGSPKYKLKDECCFFPLLFLLNGRGMCLGKMMIFMQDIFSMRTLWHRESTQWQKGGELFEQSGM